MSKRTIKDVEGSHRNSAPSFKRIRLNDTSHQNVDNNHTTNNLTSSSTFQTQQNDYDFSQIQLPDLNQNKDSNRNHNVSTSTTSQFNEKN